MATPDPFAAAYTHLASQEGPGAGNVLNDPVIRGQLAAAIADQQHGETLTWPEPHIAASDIPDDYFYTDDGHAE